MFNLLSLYYITQAQAANAQIKLCPTFLFQPLTSSTDFSSFYGPEPTSKYNVKKVIQDCTYGITLLSISIQTIHVPFTMCVLVGSVQFWLYHITLMHQSFNVLFVICYTLNYTQLAVRFCSNSPSVQNPVLDLFSSSVSPISYLYCNVQ